MRLRRQGAVLGLMTAALFITCSCAVIDPQHVGNGQYLQIRKNETVLIESDTSNVGFQNCSISAYELLRTQPTLLGMVKCAQEKTAQSMPYYFKALDTRSTAADEMLPSSTYMVRTQASVLCSSALQVIRQREKTIIVQEHCQDPD
jgi:hypothetical protein